MERDQYIEPIRKKKEKGGPKKEEQVRPIKKDKKPCATEGEQGAKRGRDQ
jgi:hypothetical protein